MCISDVIHYYSITFLGGCKGFSEKKIRAEGEGAPWGGCKTYVDGQLRGSLPGMFQVEEPHATADPRLCVSFPR